MAETGATGAEAGGTECGESLGAWREQAAQRLNKARAHPLDNFHDNPGFTEHLFETIASSLERYAIW